MQSAVVILKYQKFETGGFQGKFLPFLILDWVLYRFIESIVNTFDIPSIKTILDAINNKTIEFYEVGNLVPKESKQGRNLPIYTKLGMMWRTQDLQEDVFSTTGKSTYCKIQMIDIYVCIISIYVLIYIKSVYIVNL